MPMIFIRHVGANLAYVEPVGPVDPSFGQGGPADPGYGHPIFGRPGNELPGSGNYPSHGLPGSPGHPDNRPPASHPPTVAPGQTLVLVRDPEGIWHYATTDNSTPPPRPLPVPPPDHISGQPIPPPPGTTTPPTYPTGGPVPPTATPTRR